MALTHALRVLAVVGAPRCPLPAAYRPWVFAHTPQISHCTRDTGGGGRRPGFFSDSTPLIPLLQLAGRPGPAPSVAATLLSSGGFVK